MREYDGYGHHHLRNKKTGEERVVTQEEYMRAVNKAGYRTEVTRFETEEVRGWIGESAPISPPANIADL
jgi:hypothetical protein